MTVGYDQRIARAHAEGRERERAHAKRLANGSLVRLLAALDAASGPRAHAVGCECAAEECVRLRHAIDDARKTVAR